MCEVLRDVMTKVGFATGWVTGTIVVKVAEKRNERFDARNVRRFTSRRVISMANISRVTGMAWIPKSMLEYIFQQALICPLGKASELPLGT
jgi:hypothetical protein